MRAPLIVLASWDLRLGRATVRVTALVWTPRGLRAVTAEAMTEAEAVAALRARGVA